jgi:hypothetical protein
MEGENMEYSVLSPRSESEPIEMIGIRPRLKNLAGKTIGLFTTYKGHWVIILDEIGKQLQQKYPDIKLTSFRYAKDMSIKNTIVEVADDPEYLPKFKEWLSGVDAVIVGNADAGSCTSLLTYNATLPEKLGKPTVITANNQFLKLAANAAKRRGVPGLRVVELNVHDLSSEPEIDEFVAKIIPAEVSEVLDRIIDSLTRPLTAEEESPRVETENLPGIVFRGNLNEVNDFYYKRGWAYGMPVIPPTEEAVSEMLTGTDLPRDHVVAKLPPTYAKATVEKIAINAVMAGCLPTHMPVLIAAVEAMMAPGIWVESYTCSLASWEPLLIINGPIRDELKLYQGSSFLSPYNRANTAIGHAIGLIIMNIGGIRVGIEDQGIYGHEGHFGVCIAENEEASPWEPLHEFYGLNKKDNAVTIFFPNTRNLPNSHASAASEPGALLRSMCEKVPLMGFDPGCAVIFCPKTARMLQNNGYSRQDVVDYLVEYARQPATEVNLRWMIESFHQPKNVPLPADPTRSVRKFFSGMHIPVIVAGNYYSVGVILYGGGGDHGGPITKKVETPKNWANLVSKYQDFVTQYD